MLWNLKNPLIKKIYLQRLIQTPQNREESDAAGEEKNV